MKVGVTGGIGTGKSLVCKLFQLLQIPVYNADRRARYLMENNSMLKEKISESFGTSIYSTDGMLNRGQLSSIVFANPEKLNTLNAAVHPFVAADYQLWNQENLSAPFTIREAAIMIESGLYKDLDKIIVVDAPQSLRIQNIMTRDGRNKEEIESIMKQQMSQEEKLKYADFVIQNDEEKSMILQINSIYNQLLATN